MRNGLTLAVLVTLAGCASSSSSREDPVDTTLPNGTQSLVVDNTTVADMNATEGMDALMSNASDMGLGQSGDGSATAPSYLPPEPYTPPTQDSAPDGSGASTDNPMSNDATD